MALPNKGDRSTPLRHLWIGLLIVAVFSVLGLLVVAALFHTALAEAAPGVGIGSGSEIIEQVKVSPQTLATGTVMVRIDPALSSVAKGDVFTVEIKVDAGSEQVIAVMAYLDFDPLYLQVVDASGNPTNTIVGNGDLFDYIPVASADNVKGQIDLEVGTLLKPPASGTFWVGRIQFKALWGTGGGSTALTFVARGDKATAVYNEMGHEVLAGVGNGSVAISGETPPATPTPSPTPTRTPTSTPTYTPTPTDTPTPTATPTITPTPVGTPKTLKFQNGVSPVSSYSGIQDTYLDSQDPTAPKGSEIDLRLSTSGVRRPVIKLDFSPHLPFGARVVSAKLYLWVYYYSTNAASTDVEVYRVNRHWEESTATWRSPWGTWGCDKIPDDREATPAATARIGTVPESGTWVWLDITSPVQEWVSGLAANEGVILIAPVQYNRHLTFRSSNFYNATQHPYVEVRYYDPLPTPTPTHTATPTNTPTPTVTPTPTPMPGRIEGVVWDDRNGNGVKDAGEPGLAEATVRLYDAAHPDPEPPIRDPVVTTGEGMFSFDELPPGRYLLTMVSPVNYIPTTPERIEVLVSSGVTVRANFGAWVPATETPTATPSPTATWTATSTPTVTPSLTSTPSLTATPSLTSTPSLTATLSPTGTVTVAPSPTLSLTPTPTLTRRYRVFLPIIFY